MFRRLNLRYGHGLGALVPAVTVAACTTVIGLDRDYRLTEGDASIDVQGAGGADVDSGGRGGSSGTGGAAGGGGRMDAGHDASSGGGGGDGAAADGAVDAGGAAGARADAPTEGAAGVMDAGVDADVDAGAGLDAGPDAATDTGASDGAGGTDAGASCPLGMIPVTTAASDAYCTDTHEVTNERYGAFLASAPSTSGQPAYCTWNAAFEPSQGWPAAAGTERRPVAYVDWCDARAYCAWAGKRLCGAVGGGAVSVALATSAASSQWHNACSLRGARSYPYGNSWLGVCNDFWEAVGAVQDVGAASQCEGGFTGLFDLCGNVAEWEDACTGSSGASDACLARGASFTTKPTAQLRCDSTAVMPARSTTSAEIGFRCCGDG